MIFRQEKKLDIVNHSIEKIYIFLIKNGFVKAFPDRKIFSCYFDTINFAMHNQSEEGIVPRKKIRIRWYNDIKKNNFFLEKKITLFNNRFKTSNKINLQQFQIYKKYGIIDNSYGICNPKLIIEYNRSYFKNLYFRVTVDTNISYKKFNLFPINKVILDKKPVMEVKYDDKINQSFFEKIFFFKETRFSKYSRGINLIRNIN